MFGNKVNSRGLGAWALAALAAPAAQFFGSLPWPWVLGASLLAGALWYPAWTCPGPLPRLLTLAGLALTVPALTLAARFSGACWPGVPDGIQGWALLAFSGWAALRGSRAGTRYGAIVFWVTAGAYGVLLLCALPGVKTENLTPAYTGGRPWALLFLLLPLGQRAFEKEGAVRPWIWMLGTILGATALATICGGCLSPARAGATSCAFFDMIRGIRLLGVAERFEAVVSGIMTMGWFCCMTWTLSVAGELGRRLHPKGGLPALLTVLTLAAVLNAIV